MRDVLANRGARFLLAALVVSMAMAACAKPETAPGAKADTTAHAPAATGTASASPKRETFAIGKLQKRLPGGFAVAGYSPSDDGGVCFVGSKLSEDGDGRAWVHMMDPEKGALRWSTPIALDSEFFQNRTTHCLCRDAKCRVLVATDTQSMQSLSQTLLSVATLSSADGKLMSVTPIETIPGAPGDASAWVEPGEANFAWRGGDLVVKGKYRGLDSDEIRDFELTIAP